MNNVICETLNINASLFERLRLCLRKLSILQITSNEPFLLHSCGVNIGCWKCLNIYLRMAAYTHLNTNLNNNCKNVSILLSDLIKLV